MRKNETERKKRNWKEERKTLELWRDVPCCPCKTVRLVMGKKSHCSDHWCLNGPRLSLQSCLSGLVTLSSRESSRGPRIRGTAEKSSGMEWPFLSFLSIASTKTWQMLQKRGWGCVWTWEGTAWRCSGCMGVGTVEHLRTHHDYAWDYLYKFRCRCSDFVKDYLFKVRQGNGGRQSLLRTASHCPL